MRALTPSATLLTDFGTVDLAAGAWPEAFEMPRKAI